MLLYNITLLHANQYLYLSRNTIKSILYDTPLINY